MNIPGMKTFKKIVNSYKDAIGHELLLINQHKETCRKIEPAHYWIFEKSDGNFYLYSESKDHHHVGEASRKNDNLQRMDEEILGDDCDVTFIPDNSYFVLKFSACDAANASSKSRNKRSGKASKKPAKKTNKKK